MHTETPAALNLFLSLILGLFGGAGVWLIESRWRPTRDRRRAARILLRELEFNRDELVHIQNRVIGKSNPPPTKLVGYRISRIGLTSVNALLSELPSRAAGEVIRLYDLFNHLDEVFEYYQRANLELRGLPDQSTTRGQELAVLVRGSSDEFRALVKVCLELSNRTIEDLRPVAHETEEKAS